MRRTFLIPQPHAVIPNEVRDPYKPALTCAVPGNFYREPAPPPESDRILRRNPLAIMPARHFTNPCLVRQIPLHRLADPAFKRLPRLPTQVALNLARIHGITPVMAGPILDIRNQLFVRDD